MKTNYMKPAVYEFMLEKEVLAAVNNLEVRGVAQEDIYVLTHEKGRTDEIADQADINTIGVREEGMGTTIMNLFKSTGDQLRSKMEEMGLSEDEASIYEEKLDQGKILLFITDRERVHGWLQDRRV